MVTLTWKNRNQPIEFAGSELFRADFRMERSLKPSRRMGARGNDTFGRLVSFRGISHRRGRAIAGTSERFLIVPDTVVQRSRCVDKGTPPRPTSRGCPIRVPIDSGTDPVQIRKHRTPAEHAVRCLRTPSRVRPSTGHQGTSGLGTSEHFATFGAAPTVDLKTHANAGISPFSRPLLVVNRA